MNNRTQFNPNKSVGVQSRMKEIPPGTPIQVDLTNARRLSCECGNETFGPAVQVYLVSALISPTGQELLVNQQVVVCTKCQKIFDGSAVK